MFCRDRPGREDEDDDALDGVCNVSDMVESKGTAEIANALQTPSTSRRRCQQQTE